MAVVFKKKAEKYKTDADLSKEQLNEVIDDYAVALEEVAKLKKKLTPYNKRIDAAAKKLRDRAENDPADNTVIFTGDEHSVELSPKKSKATVIAEMEEIFDLVGQDVFEKLISYSITEMRKYLTEDQLKKVMKEELTGARTIKLLS